MYKKHIFYQIVVAACAIFSLTACSGESSNEDTEVAKNDSLDAMFVAPRTNENLGVRTEFMEIADNNLVHRIKVNPIGGSLRQVFNDSNALHLTAAKAIGIDPITNLQTAFTLRRPIQEIYTCDAYHIDDLTHSMPYLVPRAARLLHDIGVAFTDSVLARGGSHYKIKVTSIMRTDISVAKLRRRNRNATQDSAHRYGTTFDVSYSKFMCCDSTYIVSLEDLKNILAEVLYQKRKEGRCYVKFERKQGCFHITTR